MNPRLRTAVRVLAVSALTAGAVPFGSAVHADGIHTDTKLAGFDVLVSAAPLQVMLDDPELQVPRPTGSDVVEGDPNYTSAEVATGPNAHAIASSLWPGNLFGEGLPALANGQAYPLKAEARYPDKPYTSTGPDGGVSTNATAEGLDAFGQADGTPTNKPGQVTVGSVTSTSTATVTDKDVALGNAVSALQNVDLLGGIIHVGQVATHITASTDGKKPAVSGTTTMSGLTIAGNAFSLDDKGLHAGPQSSGLPATLGTPKAISDALGITVTGLTQTTAKSSNGITRFAGGVVIKIDTAPLRAALAPVLTNVNPVLRGLIAQMPPQVASNLYYFTKATPNITFVLGSASVGSAATLPLSFNFDNFPPPSFGSAPGLGTGTGTGGTPSLGGSTPPLLPGGTGAGGIPPAVSGPQTSTPNGTNAASTTDAGGGGIGAGYLALALGVAGLVGWGLTRFLGLAGGSVLGFGCRLGAPTSVPDLRSVTS